MGQRLIGGWRGPGNAEIHRKRKDATHKLLQFITAHVQNSEFVAAYTRTSWVSAALCAGQCDRPGCSAGRAHSGESPVAGASCGQRRVRLNSLFPWLAMQLQHGSAVTRSPRRQACGAMCRCTPRMRAATRLRRSCCGWRTPCMKRPSTRLHTRARPSASCKAMSQCPKAGHTLKL